MQGTELFKGVIKEYLGEKAIKDPLFAKTYSKENKNIDDCITYIINEVKRSNKCGFTDEEIYGMAVHYYDEDDINVGKRENCRIVVNHSVKDEPKNEPKNEPKKIVDMKPRRKAKKEDVGQLSLF